MTDASQAIVDSFSKSLDASETIASPYDHWNLEECLPTDVADAILDLPFEAPDLEGVSGKRELHNKTRNYFDIERQEEFPVCAAFAEAFQDKAVTDKIRDKFGIDLSGSYLRVEYAQDTDGFWLEPHTDLGVKLFTMLIYLSKDESHKDLGTDLYDADKKHVGRSPFEPNGALVFIPSGDTYHGFEARPIEGVRTSLIVNYVTDEWRAREQLAYPEEPIK